jgi:hypothetical protein
VLTRRRCFALFIPLFPIPVFARPKLGDEEWMRRFREFVRTFNSFVEVLNDGKFDISKWNSMRAAWKELDPE